MLLRTCGFVMVNRNTRTHGGSQGNLAKIMALGGGRLGALNGGQQRVGVARNMRGGKTDFTDGEWIIAVLSTRNSTLPAFISLTALATSNVTVPVLGLGIRPRGPEDLTQPACGPHHVRRGDDGIVVGPAFQDFLHHVVPTEKIRAGFLRFAKFFAGGQHENSLGLTQAVRERHSATNHLIGLLGVHAKIQHQLDRLVEFDIVGLLQKFGGFFNL